MSNVNAIEQLEQLQADLRKRANAIQIKRLRASAAKLGLTDAETELFQILIALRLDVLRDRAKGAA